VRCRCGTRACGLHPCAVAGTLLCPPVRRCPALTMQRLHAQAVKDLAVASDALLAAARAGAPAAQAEDIVSLQQHAGVMAGELASLLSRVRGVQDQIHMLRA